MPKSAAAPPVELQPHNRQQLRSTLIWRREMEERAASRHWNGNLMRLSANLAAEMALQALRDHSFSAQPQDSVTKQAAAQCLRLLAQRPGERDPASIQPADPRLYEAAQKLKLLLETGKPNDPITDKVRQELHQAGNAIVNRVLERIGVSEDDLFPETALAGGGSATAKKVTIGGHQPWSRCRRPHERQPGKAGRYVVELPPHDTDAPAPRLRPAKPKTAQAKPDNRVFLCLPSYPNPGADDSGGGRGAPHPAEVRDLR